jgi:hypothetical protein
MLPGILIEIDLRRLRLRRVLVYGEKHGAADLHGPIEMRHDADEPWVPIEIGVAVKTEVV